MIAQAVVERRSRIFALRGEIDSKYGAINSIAEAHIPGFHFLDHKVSTFWECDTSPIGVCVFRLGKWGHPQDCIYCGDPEERK